MVHGEPWPSPELWPVFALAQHHGVPTRFLDWSNDPHIALYFAASGLMADVLDSIEFSSASESLEKRAAVWFTDAISLEGNVESGAPKLPHDSGYRVRVVECPYFQNPNLAAQKGVFTLVINRDQDIQADTRPLDMIWAEEIVGTVVQRPPDNAFSFARLDFGPAVAYGVLIRLSKLGYDAATIFPGFRGCADVIHEQARLKYFAKVLRDEEKKDQD